MWLRRRPARYAVRYTNLDVLAGVAASSRSWRRHAGLALFLLALAALLVGFARPSMTRLADREEATVVLVVDVSGSMQAKDVAPTRLEAAQDVMRQFIEKLPPRFQVGLVAFSEQAEVVAPATDDHDFVIDSISYLYPQRGTNIGDAIARAVQVVRAAPVTPPEPGAKKEKQTPAAILLLSDGSQTVGLLSPLQGAQRAKSFKIPVYTVALGHAGGPDRAESLRGQPGDSGAARRGDPPPDRVDHGREGVRGKERRGAERGLREAGVARQQGRAGRGGDGRVPRSGARAAARGGGGGAR